VKASYPLEALQVLREARVDDCVQKLGAAASRASAACSEQSRAEAELLRARANNREAASLTRERLDQGLTRVVELAQAADCARAGATRERCLFDAERAARQRASEAERARNAAQLDLGSARSELSALERHHEQWQMARAREAEAREEDAALERWNAERFGPGRL
jgi:hypothetical protein